MWRGRWAGEQHKKGRGGLERRERGTRVRYEGGGVEWGGSRGGRGEARWV